MLKAIAAFVGPEVIFVHTTPERGPLCRQSSLPLTVSWADTGYVEHIPSLDELGPFLYQSLAPFCHTLHLFQVIAFQFFKVIWHFLLLLDIRYGLSDLLKLCGKQIRHFICHR